MSGHDCGNGGIYHPPGSAPNGPWNLGQAGAHIGGQWVGGGLVGLVRASQGQSTNIKSFVQNWSQTQLQIVQMTTPSQLCLSDAIVIWP